MSSIPKARKSNINDLVVTPDSWDSYPVVERSTINASKFENLSSETHITRSTLNNVIVKEGSRREDLGDTRSNEITRCELACCTISGACISRSELADTVVIDTDYMNRVESQNTKFINSGHIEKSHFEGSFVASGSDVERSTVKRSVVADSSQIRRSQLDGIVLTNSQVSKSVLQDCEVVRCEITNTNFTGKTLKYGIWVDGDLVGRTSEEEEVVIKEVPDITSLMQRAIMGLGAPTSDNVAKNHVDERVSELPGNENAGPSNSEKRATTIPRGTEERDAPPPYESHFS